MRRRWIAAGVIAVALLATLAVSVLGSVPAAHPKVIWYCATSHEVRESPNGETRSDLLAIPFIHQPTGAWVVDAPDLVLCRAPTLAQRAVAWITRSPVLKLRIDYSTPTLHATGTVETADDRSWERFEFGLPPAPAPR